MAFQRRLRFGAAFMIIGSLLAAIGEFITAKNLDVLGSSWHLSLGLVIIGTFILLIGLFPFASISEQVNSFGFLGCNLLIPGGLLLIIGTTALDWIILPFLINLGNAVAAAINGPTTETQNALNKIISSLNGLGGPVLQKLFPGATPHIPIVHIPEVAGITIINKVLVELHLPTLERLEWWGHFSLSAGTLTPGCLILGIALLYRARRPMLSGILLSVFALLNLLCQFDAAIPLYFENITAAILFLTLAWLGISAWLPKGQDVASL